MKLHKDFPYPLYLVVSSEACIRHPMLHVIEQAILGGVSVIQLREKELTTEAFIALAKQVKAITSAYKIPLIINDTLEVAMAIDADGIHVGNNDMPPSAIQKTWQKPSAIIGYSIEYEAQLENEEIEYCTYIAASPVFATATKTDTVVEWGAEGVQRLAAKTTKPLVAIGNMNVLTIPKICNAGAHSIAVVSAICAEENPKAAAETLLQKINNYEEEL